MDINTIEGKTATLRAARILWFAFIFFCFPFFGIGLFVIMSPGLIPDAVPLEANITYMIALIAFISPVAGGFILPKIISAQPSSNFVTCSLVQLASSEGGTLLALLYFYFTKDLIITGALFGWTILTMIIAFPTDTALEKFLSAKDDNRTGIC